ncbi:hypothetical protein BGZ57DRAFT_779386, partial [Hyaloscypha finlandica]
ELINTISYIEELGFTYRDLAIYNLTIDSFNYLKLFDFSSTIINDYYNYIADVKRDYSSLAICLHYILTRVDSFTNIDSI